MAVAQKSGVFASTCFGCSRVLHSRESSPTAAPSLKDLDAHYRAFDRKAADGGNCVAMMAIGDLYSNGHGVPADQAQAQSWHAKAQSCQGGNLALLQQQLAQYKASAAAARDPALYPMLSAMPVIPKSAPVAAGNRNRSGLSVNSKLLVGLVAGAAIAAAIIALTPSSGTENSDGPPGLLSQLQGTMWTNAAMACAASGGNLGMNSLVCN